MVGFNPARSDPAAPFVGVKQNGIGREGGHEGMLEFLESKYIGKIPPLRPWLVRRLARYLRSGAARADHPVDWMNLT